MANRYTATNAPEVLLESGVDPSLWPTEYQLERFGEFITQPIDVDGEWWAGSCPFHGGANSAWFNWRRGVYRCMAEDVEDPCHYPGKSQTLTNIVDMIKFTGSKHVAIIKPTELTEEEQKAMQQVQEQLGYLGRSTRKARSRR